MVGPACAGTAAKIVAAACVPHQLVAPLLPKLWQQRGHDLMGDSGCLRSLAAPPCGGQAAPCRALSWEKRSSLGIAVAALGAPMAHHRPYFNSSCGLVQGASLHQCTHIDSRYVPSQPQSLGAQKRGGFPSPSQRALQRGAVMLQQDPQEPHV